MRGAHGGQRTHRLVAVVTPDRAGAAIVVEARAHVWFSRTRILGEEVVAAMLAPSGDGVMGQCLRQCLDDGFHDLDTDINGRGANGCRVLAVHDGTGRRDNLNRLHRPLIMVAVSYTHLRAQ